MKTISNLLLKNLPAKALNRIINTSELIEMQFGTILCEAKAQQKFVYFPLQGFISSVVNLRDHHPLEMTLIGNEGMLGATLALGVNAAPMQALVQGAGSALRLTSAQFMLELRSCPSFLEGVHRYIYMTVIQLAQTGACTHFHEIEQRLARWLLMSHDRAHIDHFHLTQEFLANMLGVRRSSISIAAGELQEKKLINYNRGEIHIINRNGLEKKSCECYEEMIKGDSSQ